MNLMEQLNNLYALRNEYINFLRDTDWYRNRYEDCGEPIPEEITLKRNMIREKINLIDKLVLELLALEEELNLSDTEEVIMYTANNE